MLKFNINDAKKIGFVTKGYVPLKNKAGLVPIIEKKESKKKKRKKTNKNNCSFEIIGNVYKLKI
ncbi:hypothetical protein [Caminibacter sp.]